MEAKKKIRKPSKASAGTQNKILDAAELLMSERGFQAVGLREIAKLAEVNLGSVTYFFGTKEHLLAAIYERHTTPMNTRRKQLLLEAEEIDDVEKRLEAIIRAYVSPAFVSQSDEMGGGVRFTRLRGIVSMEGAEASKQIIASSFNEISEMFIASLARCVPSADRVSLVWRGQFLLGALYYALVSPERVDRLTGQPGSGADHNRAIEELVRASIASIQETIKGPQT